MADKQDQASEPQPKDTKSITYNLVGGGKKTIEYDPFAPCWYCELAVGEASMGGTVVCGACDCGRHRDGRQWTLEEANQRYANFRRHQEQVNGLVTNSLDANTGNLQSAPKSKKGNI